ncbi:peptide deformylase [Ferrimonas balearica]|uniref:peptide deformylase n=1 Tax=Ferrimonas balearica TaxID=44012 RepID=UPI001C99B401|nr:peptide deformylase [Ferrimonas balearica]MBY5922421.1 peptide deformylase [Ferrimonas balearica]MBY5995405.1 peptide deformylase [Ferrimonas balearica]
MAIAQLGEPILRQRAQPVTDPTDPAIQTLWQRMLVTMEAAGGVGIAAPQVFESLRLMIIASRPNARYPDAPQMAPVVLINPEIIATGGEPCTFVEGCLSVPGIRGQVTRPSEVEIRYLDIQGQPQQLNLTGFPARIFLHEYDHLEGRTFLDQVASPADLIAQSVWEKQCQSA